MVAAALIVTLPPPVPPTNGIEAGISAQLNGTLTLIVTGLPIPAPDGSEMATQDDAFWSNRSRFLIEVGVTAVPSFAVPVPVLTAAMRAPSLATRFMSNQ